jgi:hypothetical protein
VEYLQERAEDKIAAPEVYLDDAGTRGLNTLREAQAAAGAIEIEFSKPLYVGNLPSIVPLQHYESQPPTVASRPFASGPEPLRAK